MQSLAKNFNLMVITNPHKLLTEATKYCKIKWYRQEGARRALCD